MGRFEKSNYSDCNERNKKQRERRNTFFISSLYADNSKKLEHTICAYWAVEKNLHWVLDMTFDEDSNQTRQGYSASNLVVIRHIAFNLIKKEKTSKVGVKTKRLKAG
ncbi:MAG: hypothetical protein L3J59_13555 [Methylococcaceae bacterium]|nr:hypothetical protein [Methylococcaceae bacterium]